MSWFTRIIGAIPIALLTSFNPYEGNNAATASTPLMNPDTPASSTTSSPALPHLSTLECYDLLNSASSKFTPRGVFEAIPGSQKIILGKIEGIFRGQMRECNTGFIQSKSSDRVNYSPWIPGTGPMADWRGSLPFNQIALQTLEQGIKLFVTPYINEAKTIPPQAQCSNLLKAGSLPIDGPLKQSTPAGIEQVWMSGNLRFNIRYQTDKSSVDFNCKGLPTKAPRVLRVYDQNKLVLLSPL